MSESIEIVLLFGPDGQAQAAIPKGTTFERAAPALKQFFEELGLGDLPIVMTGEIEQHADHPEQAKVRAATGLRFGQGR